MVPSRFVDCLCHVGQCRNGAQEHFYLETNAAVAIPSESDELLVWSSTQNPTGTQMTIATVLNVPANRIVCKVRIASAWCSYYIAVDSNFFSVHV